MTFPRRIDLADRQTYILSDDSRHHWLFSARPEDYGKSLGFYQTLTDARAAAADLAHPDH